MTGQQFNLRWNNHTNNLVQVFADQYEREQMVDVTLTTQGKFLKAHRMVLGACSPYFQEIFDRHDTTPHPIIIMNGFEFEDVQAVVEFMYKGEVMVSESVMSRLLKAAEGLQIKGLSNVRSKREAPVDVHDDDGDKASDLSSPNCELPNRRTSGGGGSEIPERPNVPLHRRRKRARTTSHDTKKAKQQTQSPKSEGNITDTSRSTEDIDHEDPMDDLLTAINIEPPLLRDIDANDIKTEWDSPLKDAVSRKQKVKDANTSDEKLPFDFEQKEKIPRPPNSFMIFANEWRRQLANQFPNESNKEISVRLGLMWKNLSEELKAKYFTAARQANDAHKIKFPHYHYNPKEARLRKMWKMQQAQMGHMVAAGHQ
ncbi:protein tramtrack, beta isoform isoform X2 [Folsomia candida]|uniref:protein tramtrack, beta isoform isoform X2 n=1 Tax=Folsomia candida TaxID=158441 RepID=UPI000B8FD22D|nr:protein tramtrack, beta isoform isoform X2 [Folsomia candida]